MSELTDAQNTAVMVVARTTCAFTIVGAISILCIYMQFPITKTVIRSLVVGLSLCDLGTGLSDILPSDYVDSLCKPQALLGIFFPVASFLETSGIGLVIYLSLTGEAGPRQELYTLNNYIHLVSFLIPLILTICIASLNVEGQSADFGTPVCWIPYDNRDWRLLGGKAVEWASWVFIVTIYILIWLKLRRLNIASERLRTASTKMLFIPALFIIMRIPSAYRTIRDYTVGEDTLFWLSILQAIGDYGQGAVNACGFLWTQSEVRKHLKEYCWPKAPEAKTTTLDWSVDNETAPTAEITDEDPPYHSVQEGGGLISIQSDVF